MKTKILTLFLALTVVFSATACNKNRAPNNPETLEIYSVKLGYGIDWIKALIEDFKTVDWINDKYPDMKIYFDYNTERNFASDRLQSGRTANTIDLLFGMDLFKLYGAYDTNAKPILANLDDVYSSIVPGEDITFEDKMLENFRVKRNGSYYGMSWSSGYDGFMYNADLLQALDIEVPVTTDELIAAAEKVKNLNGQNSAYPYTYSFVSSVIEAYWAYMIFPQLWGQYEGLENYENYYNGIHNETHSNAVLRQRGRLESLKVMETLLKSSNGYMFNGSTALDFMEAQTRFLTGMSLFMACGDWFDIEMKDVINGLKPQYDFNVTSMRTPVISAIVDKTPSITALATEKGKTHDEVLAEVIRAIDNDQTAYEGVSNDDFNRVAKARFTVSTIGYQHNAVIPDYASAKDLAKDFMLYMATDRANEVFLTATKGAGLPFNYVAKDKNPALYNSFTSLQKVRHDVYFNDTFEAQILPSSQKFELVYNGSFGAFKVLGGSLDSIFFTGAKTAQKIYQDEIDYWTDSRWNQLITNAGL